MNYVYSLCWKKLVALEFSCYKLANFLESLQERLESGETVLCAEGYALGLARRGYTGTGLWIPQFMVDYPEVLTGMHYEFVHCGSDVVQALQVGECRRLTAESNPLRYL